MKNGNGATSVLRPLEWAMGRFSRDMGIDLGTANTLVCVNEEGIVLREPSVVAVRKGTNQVLLDGNAVGNTAKAMIGKTPGTIDAIRPLKNGVIADFEVTEKMLRYFINKVHDRSRWVRPRIVIAIPSGITAVEKQAVINSAERAGARRVYLVDEPIAAGIGAGLPITNPSGSMIVDIGGGTTEVAVLSLAGAVVAESERVAGDEMDEAIIDHCRRVHNLFVGQPTAERAKMEIGSAHASKKEEEYEIGGRDLTTGFPRKIKVSSEEVREALSDPLAVIVGAIKRALNRTPPELASDLVSSGITLAGGGALLKGLDRLISKETGLPVHVADDPLTCVARGTWQFLTQLNVFAEVLESADSY